MKILTYDRHRFFQSPASIRETDTSMRAYRVEWNVDGEGSIVDAEPEDSWQATIAKGNGSANSAYITNDY